MAQANPTTLAAWMGTWDRWLNVPAGTLGTIAAIETSYNPATGYYSSATSPVGAKGLMQMMPIAVAGVKQEYGVDIDPLVPALSVMGAALHLSLTRRYMRNSLGDTPMTLGDLLAGYNGGWSVGRNRALGQTINAESSAYVSKARSLGLDVDSQLT
jgi:soluble lytic murein transglycosylase-like protein